MVAPLQLSGKTLGLLLNSQRGQTTAERMILQCDRRAEQRHDAVARELVDGAPVPLYDNRPAVENFGHDLA
jgi:hypothetical protein